ncbi:uri1, prefoldin-like chaperone [Actinomortierella wolfii]|nr:uri1, prefoldin-like chaperone [Actinomortierella wolfii]
MSAKGKQKKSGPTEEANATELSTYFARVSAALARIDEEMARWNNYKTDYEALKQTLLDLPKETTHDIMVPIGNLAFMPGQLIHTNEVLVMLGDNWFVDRSAHQAAEIVDRRVALVQENLDKLIEQQKELREKSGIAPGLLGGQEYNEEGLPIVEIVEPYHSDNEIEVEQESKKVYNPELLPTPKKSKEQQAKDAALLKRLEELEREDEERERRRAAGEEVTSDEDDDDDEEEEEEEDEDEEEYDSEDDFRPKNLDSDEEYPEALYDDSEDEEHDVDRDEAAPSNRIRKKTVRFADDTKKEVPVRSTAVKPRSPADLIQRMKNRSAGSTSSTSGDSKASHVVTLDNLEATLARMNMDEDDEPTGLPKELDWNALERMALRDKNTASVDKGKQVVSPTVPEATPLQPPQKKQSLFKQSRQGAVGEVQETKPSQPTTPVPAPVAPAKKMSRFAQQRAQAAEANATPGARGGLSDVVVERGVVEKAKPVQETIVERPAVTGFRDVIENTFTKPTSSASSSSQTKPEPGETAEPSTRKKKSLFRQLAQKSSSLPLEPEPAVPGEVLIEAEESSQISGTATIPQVKKSQPPSNKTPTPVIGGVKIPEVGKASSSSSSSSSRPVRVIKPVESTQLRDTMTMKGGVVERGEVEPVDEDEVEEDMLMRQVVNEYQEKRQAMIAKYGAFNRDDIERIWEQQIILPPEVKEALQEAEVQERQLMSGDSTDDTATGSHGKKGEGEEGPVKRDQEGGGQQQQGKAEGLSADPKNERPKKVSLFRAARLTGALAKE